MALSAYVTCEQISVMNFICMALTGAALPGELGFVAIRSLPARRDDF
jgi:hypothetical protein